MKTVIIENLKTVNSFAKSMNITAAYIYKMVKEGKMQTIEIDGVQFIDVTNTKFTTTRK
jgi:hypothetical protein